MHYVVLGNGVAGIEAALALRARDARARISVVSAEHDHFFSRPRSCTSSPARRACATRSPTTGRSTSACASSDAAAGSTHLDAAGHALVFEDGARLGYDKLLLAVGSKAREAPWPGAPGAGLHYFVTLRDLEGLDRAARRGERAVVVGGGLIGVEVAEILHARGLQVTFVIRESWYFPLALDAQESGLVAEHMRAHGVDVRSPRERRGDPARRGRQRARRAAGDGGRDPLRDRRLGHRCRRQHEVPRRLGARALEGRRHRSSFRVY